MPMVVALVMEYAPARRRGHYAGMYEISKSVALTIGPMLFGAGLKASAVGLWVMLTLAPIVGSGLIAAGAKSLKLRSLR
jgi:hypothetical protein